MPLLLLLLLSLGIRAENEVLQVCKPTYKLFNKFTHQYHSLVSRVEFNNSVNIRRIMSQASMLAVYLRASLNIHCSMGEIIERFLYWPCDSDFLNNKYFFNSVKVDDPSQSCPDLRGKSPMRRIYVQSKGAHQILCCRLFAQRADGYPQFCNLFFWQKIRKEGGVLYPLLHHFLTKNQLFLALFSSSLLEAVFGSLLVCANTPSSLCPFWRIFEILQHKFRQDP